MSGGNKSERPNALYQLVISGQNTRIQEEGQDEALSGTSGRRIAGGRLLRARFDRRRSGGAPCQKRQEQAGGGQEGFPDQAVFPADGRSHDYHSAGRRRHQRRAGGGRERELCRRDHHPVRGDCQRRAGRVSGEQGGEGHRSPTADGRRHQQGAAGRPDRHHPQRRSGGGRRGAAGGGRRRPGGRPCAGERQHEGGGGRIDRRIRPCHQVHRPDPPAGQRQRRAAGRPEEHGLHGLHCGLWPRQRRHYRHRHGHRDGQDRGRPLQCRAGPDSAADQAQPALKDPHLARARHLRHHFRGAAPARGRLQL